VTPSVHEVAAVGFDSGAEAYERGRPGFPLEAVQRLVEELGIAPDRTVVDLAAGTGKLTRLLSRETDRLLAVEPVEGMRREFVRLLPDVPVLAGVAEAMPFRDSSLDAVTVAQAFHWFDGPAALAELHRVLRPGGRLGLVWNVRDESLGLSAALTELFDRYRQGAPAFRDRAWQRAFEETTLFTPLETATFPHEQLLTVEGFLDRAMSVSFMAALSPDQQPRVRGELLALLPPGPTEVVLPYRCEVSWCERRP
jgi:ubiquinone/menaquinone biosynthesis C-methylase UbiE